MRALIGAGARDEFDDSINLICHVPDIGTIALPHRINLGGTVGDAIDGSAPALCPPRQCRFFLFLPGAEH